MKKILSLLTAFVLLFSVAVFADPDEEPAAAEIPEVTETVPETEGELPENDGAEESGTVPAEDAEESSTVPAQDSEAPVQSLEEHPESVVDKAELLSEYETENIKKLLDNIREKYNFDACLYIDDYMNADDPWYEANGLYDKLGYGLGENRDGMMLYNCPSERKYAFSTYGSGNEIFNDYVLDRIEPEIVAYLKNNDYYGAFCEFAEQTEIYLRDASEGIIYDGAEERAAEKAKNRSSAIAVISIVDIIIAFAMTGAKKRKMNTAVKSDYAANYMKPGSMKLTNSQDLYLYSHTTRTRIERDSSRSSGGSSGGHGGRGGSY